MKVHKLEKLWAKTPKGELMTLLVPFYIRKFKNHQSYEPTTEARFVLLSFKSW